jgi:hypothetical protein
LDPSHSRNQAVLEVRRLLRSGNFERVVVVDQHGYLDVGALLRDQVKVELVHMGNYEEVLRGLTCARPCLLLQAPGEYANAPRWVKKWSDDEQRSYDRYAAALANFPRLAGWGTERMALLDPQTPQKADEIVLRRVDVPIRAQSP